MCRLWLPSPWAFLKVCPHVGQGMVIGWISSKSVRVGLEALSELAAGDRVHRVGVGGWPSGGRLPTDDSGNLHLHRDHRLHGRSRHRISRRDSRRESGRQLAPETRPQSSCRQGPGGRPVGALSFGPTGSAFEGACAMAIGSGSLTGGRAVYAAGGPGRDSTLRDAAHLSDPDPGPVRLENDAPGCPESAASRAR